MGAKTEIAWTDATWNPLRGCTRISPGCVNCYAERMAARRLPGMGSPTTGEPFALQTPAGPRWTGRVELIESQLDIPLHWRRPRRVFVNSMSDLFHPDVTITDQERIFRVMLSAPQHTYQILTKRAPQMRSAVPIVMNRIFGSHWRMPDFIWLGVSCEDQQRADERIPHLLQTPAALRFVSLEPLLGPVELERGRGFLTGQSHDNAPYLGERLDWVIVGGESGPGARPCDLAWICSIVRQCAEAGTACFVKQLGANPTYRKVVEGNPTRVVGCRFGPLRNRKGADPEEWPADLRVRKVPKTKE